ncbi:hypothetical protein Tco_0891798 [Tanacetum coccineum]|uniref:Uncharacterized protein n=1 Tax=Tanacetum coccineum TaxID=301880 RepID=A0ABQ5C3Z6_9ASTR
MVESLPIMVDTHIKEQVKKQVPEQVRDQVPVYVAEGLIMEREKTKEEMVQMIAKAILQERGNIQAEISSQIQKAFDNHIPSQVDASLQQQDIAIWLALQIKFENLQVPQTTCRPSVVRPRDQDDPHDDAHPEGENSAKRQKTSENEACVSGESSSGQVNEKERGPSTLAKLKKMVDEMLRQRCTSGDEHQYHIDQMKNFLKSDIVWESRKEILDLLYLKKGSSGQSRSYCPTLQVSDIIFNMMISRSNSDGYQQKVNLTAPTISFPGVEKHKMFSIIYEPVHRIIYKNSKKKKRVMRHLEIHKFCDATLNRVLEGLKSYNNDVKYGYVQREFTNDEVEYLKLFEEEIEVD